MKKLKWNRKLSILVLIMFITVTFASFNTNLFIDGNAYVRVDKDIRITNIHLLETEYNGYENTGSEYTNHSISTDVSLPRQASSLTYEITISNVSDRRYKITDIIEDSYDNKDVKYELIDASIGNIVEPHTTKTFRVKFTNNVTVVEEDDVYQTLTYTFDYTGDEQEFIVPFDGDYTLEVWGASGGGSTTIENSFGYGGYSKGTIHLQKNKTLFINVGGQGIQKCDADYGYRKVFKGGYNGGGDGCTWVDNKCEGSGGGATHISYLSGTLNKLSKHKGTLVDNKYYSSQAILIVAGGGGGQGNNGYNGRAGSGGGYKGVDATGGEYWWAGGGGTQTAGGVENTLSLSKNSGFGQGSSAVNGGGNVSGGGGGFFGGGTGSGSGGYGGGGSGYIANPNLTEKVMYCFNCLESDEIQLKTISTNQHSSTPEVNKAKEGNGYAKITITRKIEDGTDIDFDYTGDQQTFTAPYTGIYRLETWGAQGGGIITDDQNIPGGYGGYSRGSIKLNKNENLNIVVGGAGSSGNKIDLDGGYNGGGSATASVGNALDASGGGATHIATVTGLLSALSEQKSKVLIVSGGGGGTHYHGNGISYPGSGGGYIGGSSENIYQKNTEYCAPGTGGTQTTGGNNGQGYTNFGTASTFGQGANYTGTYGAGGGGGWYGGGAGLNGNACAYSGNGGSGYIGNSKLSDKIMYCYNCQEIQDTNKKTVTTQSHSKRAKQNTAKEGNGYSRITLVKRTINQTKLTLDFTFEEYVNGNEYVFGYTGEPQEFVVPKTGYYKVELWGASSENHRNDYVQSLPSYGGYTSGKIKLNKGEKLYVYVGDVDHTFNNSKSKGMYSRSGGATDVRLKATTNWYDLESLSSRIMVAGGGGGTYSDSSAPQGGTAGGLVSYSVYHVNYPVYSATQTSGGLKTETPSGTYAGLNGSFGVGADNNKPAYSNGAGGYYGGGSGPAGGGGTSYISGHNGCVAIKAESDTTPRNDSNGELCTDGTIDITCSKHYSNFVFTDTKMIDGKGFEWTTVVGDTYVGMPAYDGVTTMTGNDGAGFAKITCLEEIQDDYAYDYTGKVQEFVTPYKGIYKIELWGASGGDVSSESQGSPGGYTKGNILLEKNEKIYVYVGEKNNILEDRLSYNGGGRGTKSIKEEFSKAGSGGGATDIRLLKSSWDDFESQKTRIMVASGGSARAQWSSQKIKGGEAGGLVGYNGDKYKSSSTEYELAGSTGGTQFRGGNGSKKDTPNYNRPQAGGFGIGGNVAKFTDEYIYGSGGGSGYYGGGAGAWTSLYVSAGSGGSSYISGHPGCVSITGDSTVDNITFVNDSNNVACNSSSSVGYNSNGYNTDSKCSKHYSGKVFTDTVMIDGKGYAWDENGVGNTVVGMPSPDGRTTMVGNVGNGYAKITLLEKIDTYNINYNLDGGELNKPRKTYSTFDDDLLLSNPTKPGYTFTGWTNGKNYARNIAYHLNANGTTQEYSDGVEKVNPISNYNSGVWFDITTNYRNIIEDKPVVVSMDLKADENKKIRLCIDNTGGTCKVVDVTTEWQRFYVYRPQLDLGIRRNFTIYNNDGTSPGNSVSYYIRNVQIEVGKEMTEYEPYISTPTQSITIPKGSTGNRYYKANWSQNIANLENGSTVNIRMKKAIGYEDPVSNTPDQLVTRIKIKNNIPDSVIENGYLITKSSSPFPIYVDYKDGIITWYTEASKIMVATSAYQMFARLENLTKIDVLPYFDTSNTTSLQEMFNYCYSLEEVDVSSFNTSNVTNLAGMFHCCKNLVSLDLSHFDTSKVTTIATIVSMWDDSQQTKLTGVKLRTLTLGSGWNTSNVTNFNTSFYNIPLVEELDMSAFDTSSALNMYHMFAGDTGLRTIYATNKFTPASESTVEMFSGCTSLVGGSGTTFNYSKIDGEYARIDNPPNEPGYFTLKQ